MTEGPPKVYVPVLRVPWMFPHLPGVQGYKHEVNGDRRSICWITKERVDKDANTGVKSEERMNEGHSL